jgi:hypothetical protein
MPAIRKAAAAAAPVKRTAAPVRNKITYVKDITLPKDYSLEKVGITQSLLGEFQTCRKRFLFKINRWQWAGINWNVQFGNVCHDVLEQIYKSPKVPNAKKIRGWVDDYLVRWEKKHVEASGDEMRRHGVVAIVVLEEYLVRFLKDWTDWKILGAEKEFSVFFNGVRLRGKKDITYLSKQNQREIGDHKTKGKIEEESLMLLLTFDLQTLFYVLCEELSDNVKVAAFLYNVIRNTEMKPAKDETWADFSKRLRIEIRKKPDHFFKRYRVPYREEDKRIFRQELEWKLDDVKAFLRGDLKPYKNEKACVQGFMKCEFLKACSSGTMIGYEQRGCFFPELEDIL